MCLQSPLSFVIFRNLIFTEILSGSVSIWVSQKAELRWKFMQYQLIRAQGAGMRENGSHPGKERALVYGGSIRLATVTCDWFHGIGCFPFLFFFFSFPFFFLFLSFLFIFFSSQHSFLRYCINYIPDLLIWRKQGKEDPFLYLVENLPFGTLSPSHFWVSNIWVPSRNLQHADPGRQ